MRKGSSLAPYTIEDIEDIRRAGTFADSTRVAITALERLCERKGKEEREAVPIGIITGPMHAVPGGESPAEKRQAMLRTAEFLSGRFDVRIFNYFPPRKRIVQILEHAFGDSWRNEDNLTLLFRVFYEPILETGLIRKVFFMPGWETSPVSRSIWAFANKNRIEAKFIPREFIPKAAAK